MLVQDHVLGAISIQSDKAEAFDQDDIVVLQSIADSLSGAIVNARLLSEVQANLDEIQMLHRQYLRRAWSEVVQGQGELAYTYQAPIVIEASGNERSLQVPIRLRGEVIGSMALEAEGPAGASGAAPGWAPEELALIDSIADQAALALENARLLDETQQRAEKERMRASLSTKVWSSTSVETILRTTLQELGSSLGAVEGFIQLEADE
jgi:GAF domain-containing protein